MVTTTLRAYNNYSPPSIEDDGPQTELRSSGLKVIEKLLMEILTAHNVSTRIKRRILPRNMDLLKFRSVKTSSEISFLARDSNDQLVMRFNKHHDPFYTSRSPRSIVRQINIDLTKLSEEGLRSLLTKEALDWLRPQVSNLRAPRSRLFAFYEREKAPSEFTVTTFVIDGVRLSYNDDQVILTAHNESQTLEKRLDQYYATAFKDPRDLKGMYYVEYFDGNHTVVSSSAFRHLFNLERNAPPVN